MRKLVWAVVALIALQGSLVGAAHAARTRATSVSGNEIIQTALRYVGYAYTTVGNSPSTGFSCIGFVSYVYGVNGIPVPDDLGGAMAYAAPVAFSNLLPGDVLFFGNTVWPGLSHTAIYLGGGRFVHAEWYNRGVVTSSFTNDPVDGNYWSQKYIGANRPWGVLPTPVAPPAPSQPPAQPSVIVAPHTSVSSAPVSPHTSLPPLLSGPKASIEVAGLNIRTRPSLLGPVRRVAAHGTNVVVLKQYLQWDWVQLPDRSFGWVMGSGIGAGGETQTSGTLASYAQPLSSIRSSGLRVHVRPNAGSTVITTAYRGQRVMVVEGWNTWLRIVMPQGKRGWVSGAYVDLQGGSSTTPAHTRHTRAHSSRRAFTGRSLRHVVSHAFAHRSVRQATRAHRVRTYRTTARRVAASGAKITVSLRLRAKPGLRGAAIGLEAVGSHLRVLGSWNGWVYARFHNGRTGWVYGAYVHQ